MRSFGWEILIKSFITTKFYVTLLQSRKNRGRIFAIVKQIQRKKNNMLPLFTQGEK